jgi:hypothetical protein
MKTADAGRMLFYHCTDPDTADRITRQGFHADGAHAYLLSLERWSMQSNGVVLCIALPEQAAHDILNSVPQGSTGALREFVVPRDLLRTAYVSVERARNVCDASG